MKNLIGLSYEDLEKEVISIGLPKFRAKQVWQWMYHYGVIDFESMTNLSKDLRAKLAENYSLARPEITKDLLSFDDTRKWLIKFSDNNETETVYIPEAERGTLCVSSQIGCALTCSFCHTGTQKLVRNLTPYDIVSQMMIARDKVGEWPTPNENRKISSIVMMGMGEPLLNYDNVITALKIIMSPEGLAFSRRKITLSTSGIVPLIEKCGTDIGVNLAISLHAVRDDLRDELVPINKKYPIKELLNACRNYPSLTNSRRITFEYVMLKDINDSDADARALVKLIRGIPAKINLIPFNPWPGSIYECSTKERIAKFADILNNSGYASPVRKTRGQDILAACGQLRSESMRKSKGLITNPL
jgi:23S rRNA (adenine2503-C2)-methyltransferase